MPKTGFNAAIIIILIKLLEGHYKKTYEKTKNY